MVLPVHRPVLRSVSRCVLARYPISYTKSLLLFDCHRSRVRDITSTLFVSSVCSFFFRRPSLILRTSDLPEKAGSWSKTASNNTRIAFHNEVSHAIARVCSGRHRPRPVFQLAAAFVTHSRQHTKSVERHCSSCGRLRRRLVRYWEVSSGSTT